MSMRAPDEQFRGWDESRSALYEWIESTPLQSFFHNHLTFDGFSLWWLSLVIKRDSMVKFGWYQEIHEALCESVVKPTPPVRARTLHRLFRALGSLLLVKVILYLVRDALSTENTNSSSKRVLFLSLEYNWLPQVNPKFEKNFQSALGDKNGQNNSVRYCIYLTPRFRDILHAKQYRDRIYSIKRHAGFPVGFVQNHIKFADVVRVHVRCFQYRHVLKKYLERAPNDYFSIRGVDCRATLTALLLDSFAGQIQDGLLYGIASARAVCKEEDTIVVTYGETMADNQAFYYFAKKFCPKIRILSIQHSLNNRNKLGLVHPISAFSVGNVQHEDEHKFACRPDLYLVHGEQFAAIAKEFLPVETVQAIGCIKYDDVSNITPIKPVGGGVLTLLIAPSLGDEVSLLAIASTAMVGTSWRVVVNFHPARGKQEILKFLSADLRYADFEIGKKSTIAAIHETDLVLTGYSVLAMEALMHGVPSVRLLPPNQPPAIDFDEGLPIVTSPDGLRQILDRRTRGERIVDDATGILEKFFGPFDGCAHERLWYWINREVEDQ